MFVSSAKNSSLVDKLHNKMVNIWITDKAFGAEYKIAANRIGRRRPAMHTNKKISTSASGPMSNCMVVKLFSSGMYLAVRNNIVKGFTMDQLQKDEG